MMSHPIGRDQSAHHPISGAKRKASKSAVPIEWKLEMPEEATEDVAGCGRRLEESYTDLSQIGEGTYGEVCTYLQSTPSKF